MVDFPALEKGLQLLTSAWQPWLVVVPGMLIGLIFGAIPGLSGGMAMAIFLPFTLYMDFLSAILFMTAIFTGSGFGCAIPAILINVPGTAAAVATTFDGYPMAQQGKHNEAMGLGLTASSFAEGLSYLILLILVQPIAWAVLKLGPPEMFVVAAWGLTLIAALRGRHVVRGLMSGLMGVMMGVVGTSPRGDVRGTFGIDYLMDGIPVVPALIALFTSAQLFSMMRSGYIVEDASLRKLSLRKIWWGIRHTFDYPDALIRGSLIGVIIGAVPGVGSSVANLLAYSEARRASKKPGSFGQGNPNGVVASESANSSSEGGSMATLLALGIPGGGATAIMLSAFEMHNVTGGPSFIRDHKDIVYAIILGNFAQTIIIMFVGVAFIYWASSIVKVPIKILVPSVMAVSIFGSYALVGNIAGPATLFAFSIVGWIMAKYDYSAAAMVVGLLLGKMAENELLRTYQISGGDFTYLFGRPIALVLIFLLVASLGWPVIQRRLRRKMGMSEEEEASTLE